MRRPTATTKPTNCDGRLVIDEAGQLCRVWEIDATDWRKWLAWLLVRARGRGYVVAEGVGRTSKLRRFEVLDQPGKP